MSSRAGFEGGCRVYPEPGYARRIPARDGPCGGRAVPSSNPPATRWTGPQQHTEHRG